jgi:excisionase family DNA binding protein
MPSDCQPIAFSMKEASAVSSIGRTSLYQLIKNGKLEAVKVGRRTLVNAASLRHLIETGT